MPTDDRLLLVRLEANTKKLEAQLKRASGQAIGAARGIDTAFAKSNRGVERSLARGSRRLSAATSQQRQYRGAVQNTAFQLQDLAVQISGGTKASVALGQQLPQLLGGFGALGAVIGAVVAIGIPLAASFIKTKTQASDLEEKIKELEAAVKEYEAAAKEAIIPTQELRDKYGQATDAAREFIVALREIAEVNALQQVDELLTDLIGTLSSADLGLAASIDPARGLRGELERIATILADPELNRSDRIRFQESFDEVNRLRASLVDLQVSLSDLADGAVVTEDKALAVAAALDQIAAAKGPEEQAQATAVLIAALEAAVGPYADLTEEGQALFEQLNKAGKAVAGIAGGADVATGAISNAADEASRLAENLGVSLEVANRLSRLEAQGSFPGNLDGSTGTTSTENAPDQTLPFFTLPSNPTKTTARKTGGGGGKSQTSFFEASEKQLTTLQREIELIGKTEDQVAALTAKYVLLDEAKKRGLDLDQRNLETGKSLNDQIEEQAQKIGQLTQKASQYKDQAEFIADATASTKDGFLDAIVAGESFGDVLNDLAKSLAKAALQAAIFGDGPFGNGSGGLAGNILGSLFPNFGGGGGPSFSGGGFTGSGPRSGGIDGQGGFNAILHPNETVVDHSKGQRLGGETNVQVINMGGGGARTERSTGPDGREMVKVIVGEEIGRGGFDSQLGARTGGKPRQLKR